MKRILLVMMQPPGCSGAQGLIYYKILPFLEANGWEFHFAGPSPQLSSVIIEDVNCPSARLHYTDHVSYSRKYSVLKNRQTKNSLRFYFYGVLQYFAQRIEKLLNHDPNAYLISGLDKTIKAANKKWNYDLIAGKSPDFIVLESVAKLTKSLDKPLVAMIVDPYGERNGLNFIPHEEEKQKQILDQCVGAMFMSPLTRDRYVKAGLLNQAKAYAFYDSFPSTPSLYKYSKTNNKSLHINHDSDFKTIQFAHLGMLPEWRPVGTLLEAIQNFPNIIYIDIFGYLYPEAQKQIQKNKLLSNQIHLNKPVCYKESHRIAHHADALLVIIGPRHFDNQPSKFFEYLGHRKPMLVLGPPGNPIERIINNLGIGIYCDILNRDSIIDGINKISNQYSQFVSAYDTNNDKIKMYSADQVAQHWADCLNNMLSVSSEEQIH
jgi:hypothetical protein